MSVMALSLFVMGACVVGYSALTMALNGILAGAIGMWLGIVVFVGERG